jgi:hypothetical protein
LLLMLLLLLLLLLLLFVLAGPNFRLVCSRRVEAEEGALVASVEAACEFARGRGGARVHVDDNVGHAAPNKLRLELPAPRQRR